EGLDTYYGKKGTYFSGGEVQRLAIARAMLKDADFVILDEATAFADPENEHIIQASFKELSKDKTTLLIAHRLSTVIGADRILVVDNGRIVESGTHQELLTQGGVYNKLWEQYQSAANWKIGGNR
ncbi:ATP-binding cassette domain-containing protein, partial [Porphyromonas cangingivalis]